MESSKIGAEHHKDVILAGRAIFTIKNSNTEGRFTYKVKKKKDDDIWFCHLLTGSDNQNSYEFFGTIFADMVFKFGKRSRIKESLPSVQGFIWTFNKILSATLPDHVEIWHEGRCFKCGRSLTVPESLKSGFGPECLKKLKP